MFNNISFSTFTTAVSNLWNTAKSYVTMPQLNINREQVAETVEQNYPYEAAKTHSRIDYKRLLVLSTLSLFNASKSPGLSFGLVTLFAGSVNAAFPAVIDLNDLNVSTGVILQGRAVGDFAGISVSGLGDVNGDGIVDMLLGASSASPLGRTNAGEVYIIFGRSGNWPGTFDLGTPILNSGLSVVLQGKAAADHLGTSVSALGDVNGDGIADMLLGAPNASPLGKSNAGEAYIIFGRNGSWPPTFDLNTLNSSTGVILQGRALYDSAGSAVCALGDVNGDGMADMLVGAYGASPLGRGIAGEAYILFGRNGSWPAIFDLNRLTTNTGVVLQGGAGADLLGYAISGLADINGDSIADILLGARGADPLIRTGAGAAYILFGRNGSWPVTLDFATFNSSYGVILQGSASGDNAGYSVSALGDINGDGLTDLLVGAPFISLLNRTSAGGACIIFGRNGSWPAEIDLSRLTSNIGFILLGGAANDNTGFSVSGLGDVNGDGFVDMLVAATYASPLGRVNAGETYIIFGHKGNWPLLWDLATLNNSTGVILQGRATGDFSGHSVTALGDVNGDGLVDLFIGAMNADPFGRTNAGEAYIIFGQQSKILKSSIGPSMVSTPAPSSSSSFSPTPTPTPVPVTLTESASNSMSATNSSQPISPSVAPATFIDTSGASVLQSSTTDNPTASSVSSTISSAAQSSNSIEFNLVAYSSPIWIEGGGNIQITNQYLSVSGNVNPSQVIYTVQGNNPDYEFTVNGVAVTQFTQADVNNAFVVVTSLATACEASSSPIQLQVNIAGSSTPPTDVSLLVELSSTSCNHAVRFGSAGIFNTALLMTAGTGFWAKGREKEQRKEMQYVSIENTKHILSYSK